MAKPDSDLTMKKVPDGEVNWFRRLIRRLAGPRRTRIEGDLESWRLELEQRLAREKDDARKSLVYRGALDLTVEAKKFLDRGLIDQAWKVLDAAHRQEVFAMEDEERKAKAREVIHESSKLGKWRREAIGQILEVEGDDKVPTEFNADALHKALEIRDVGFSNLFHKISLRKRHLLFCAFALLAVTVGIVVLGYVGSADSSPFAKAECPAEGCPVRAAHIWGALLFGALGAVFSVSYTLTYQPLDARIPEQRLGSFLMWMRPVIGAAAALVAYVFALSGVFEGIFDPDFQRPPAFFALAFIAGFSERLIVKVITDKYG